MVEDLFLRRLELFGPELELMPGKIQVIRAIDGHEMKMRVRHFETDHGKAAAITGKSFLYRFGDRSGENQDLTQVGVGHVEELIDLELGYYEGMSFAQGEDIQECKEFVVLCNLISGYLSGDDL